MEYAGAVTDRPEIVSVIQNYTALKKHGQEHKGLCPLHKEKTPSFGVNAAKQTYYCFGCGAGGDVYQFVMSYHGVGFAQAKELIGTDVRHIQPESLPKAVTRVTGKPPPDAPPPNMEAPWMGKLVQTWEYRDADGSLMHYVARYEDENGKKLTPQWSWSPTLVDGKPAGWAMKFWAGNKRPLYGLDRLAEDPHATVIICEGEKATDAAGHMMPDCVAVTWSGGSNGIKQADWAPLMKRASLLFWPDADEAGDGTVVAMRKIFPRIQLIQVPGKSGGWDAADALAEGLTADDVMPRAGPQRDEVPGAVAVPPVADAAPFQLLGFDSSNYYYLPKGKNQVIELTAREHSLLNFLQLAPLNYWEHNYAKSQGNATVDVTTAASDLMNRSHAVGIYSSDRIRGRGAWLDGKKRVIHLGESLIVDGSEPVSPGSIGSRYIYEARAHQPLPKVAPATLEMAKKLPKLCSMLSWENPLSGHIMCGWIIVAPVCGAMDWRPHIWLTGDASSGKSTALNEIIGPMTSMFALRIDGSTTEAFIRQSIGYDARPVILDEAEAEDVASRARIQSILNLARVSSSGGTVGRGGAGGKAQEYSVRSCFCFSSINTSIGQLADEMRISKLIIRKDTSPQAEENYQKILACIAELMTPEYQAAMFYRSVSMLHIIQANAKVFTDAATSVLKSRRAADQIGTMLGGLYICYSDDVVDYETAITWVRSKVWDNHTAITESGDDYKLIHAICSPVIEVRDQHGVKRISVGEAILSCSQGDAGKYHYADTIAVLARMGIRADSESFTVINKSAPLEKILRDTPWGKDWRRPLSGIVGASAVENSYFAPGLRGRGMRLPISVLGAEG